MKSKNIFGILEKMSYNSGVVHNNLYKDRKKMKLVLVRHVETYGNIEHRLNGHTESEYTPRGKAMKEILVDALVSLHEKVKFDQIYSSPTSRAYKIAKAVGDKTNIDVQKDLRLREFNFGIFEGKTREECLEDYNDEWNIWLEDYLDHRIPNGQSQREYHMLCGEFIKELDVDNTILIVAHGGTVHGILTNLLELPIDSKWHFDIQLGSVTIVNVSDGFGMLSEMMTPDYSGIPIDSKL